MTRLPRSTVWHLVKPVGGVRRAWGPSIARPLREAEDKQKPYTQNISPHSEPFPDPSTYHQIDFGIGITNLLERHSIPKRLEPELPIKAVQPEVQDGSPQALALKEEEIFKSRLSKIWKGMMASRMTPKWKGIISGLPTDKWLSRIMEHTPADVKSILVSPHPPTPAQIKSLPWSDTTDAGVLAWCSEPNGKQDSTEKTLHTYIASASKLGGGMRFRRRYMLSQSITPHDEALKLKIKDLDLNPEGEFKRLFIVPFKNDFGGDDMDVRGLVVLARRALMIWLGAFDEGSEPPTIKDLVPWRLENIEYLGLAKDNPLATDLNESGRTRKKKNARGQNKRTPVLPKRKLSTASVLYQTHSAGIS